MAYGWKLWEEVECSDVEFMNVEDCGIAADDEGQTAELSDAVRYSYRQLLVQILGTSLKWQKNENLL